MPRRGAPGTPRVEPWEPLLAKVGTIAESGAQSLGLAALEDGGPPRYSGAVAEEVVAAGMPRSR